jgi:hypothetical protein
LQDLRPFFESALILNGRRVAYEEGAGISFITPDDWRTEPAIRPRYKNMTFDRKDRNQDAAKRLLGVGHKVLGKALEQSRNRSAAITAMPASALSMPIVVFRIIDRVTEGSFKPDAIVGLRKNKTDHLEIIRDWELLKVLNELPLRSGFMRDNPSKPPNVQQASDILDRSSEFLRLNLNGLNLDFRIPDIEFLSIIWPKEFESN